MNAIDLCQNFSKLQTRKSVSLVSLAAFIALVGCSKEEPRLGDVIRDQGVELAGIGDQWTEGNELIDEGRDQVEQGQDMINEGERLLETGKDNITRGQQGKQQAELTYRQKTGRELPVIQ